MQVWHAKQVKAPVHGDRRLGVRSRRRLTGAASSANSTSGDPPARPSRGAIGPCPRFCSLPIVKLFRFPNELANELQALEWNATIGHVVVARIAT
jgi:hypothetical protein